MGFVLKYQIEIDIPVLPKLPNQMSGSHWGTRHKHAVRWKFLVWTHFAQFMPDGPLKKAKVVMTRFSSRVPDYDNLAASFKPVLDGLVHHGVLKDDAMSIVGKPEYNHHLVGANKARIQIRIEEL